MAKAAAPVLGSALQGSKHPAAALAGHLIGGLPGAIDGASEPVVVSGVETVLYLDDSGSMTWAAGVAAPGSSRLDEGRRAVSALAPLLQGPCRVLKFGSYASVLMPRDDAASGVASSLVHMSWNGTSGGTYMWHMIEQDVRARYTPGGGKLRLVAVTA